MASLKHPNNLKYTKTDEWVRVEGKRAYIGITDYAQDQLGDIVYVDLPWDSEPHINRQEKFGDIESVKATSELISPMSGKVIQVNEDLQDHPEFINDDPYDKGWILEIKLSDPTELDNLMDAEHYIQYLEGR